MSEVIAIESARLPWKNTPIDATSLETQHRINYIHDSESRIKNCLSCPYDECFNCYGDGRISIKSNSIAPARSRGGQRKISDIEFIELYRSGLALVEIAEIKTVSLMTCYRMKRRLINNATE